MPIKVFDRDSRSDRRHNVTGIVMSSNIRANLEDVHGADINHQAAHSLLQLSTTGEEKRSLIDKYLLLGIDLYGNKHLHARTQSLDHYSLHRKGFTRASMDKESNKIFNCFLEVFEHRQTWCEDAYCQVRATWIGGDNSKPTLNSKFIFAWQSIADGASQVELLHSLEQCIRILLHCSIVVKFYDHHPMYNTLLHIQIAPYGGTGLKQPQLVY